MQHATLGSATRKRVERILEYLAKREQRTCWSGRADEADTLRLAWWTVWFAAYQQAPNPYDAALRKLLGPRYKQFKETHNTVPAFYAGPDPDDGELDGRNGAQWVQSVLAYLDWRSGDSWRPMRDRNAPERRVYTDACLALRMAFFGPPSAPPKRPAQAVKPGAKSKAA